MNKITIGEYSNLKQDKRFLYDSFLSNLKPQNKFLNKSIDLYKISYKEVRMLFKLASQNINSIDKMKDLFCIAYSVNETEFYSASIDEAFSAKNYVIKFLKDTQETETKLLKSISMDDGLWQQAGGDRLNPFSDLMPLVQLGKIYGMFPFELENKPYQQILVLLTLHKIDNEVQNNYNELKFKKK